MSSPHRIVCGRVSQSLTDAFARHPTPTDHESLRQKSDRATTANTELHSSESAVGTASERLFGLASIQAGAKFIAVQSSGLQAKGEMKSITSSY